MNTRLPIPRLAACALAIVQACASANHQAPIDPEAREASSVSTVDVTRTNARTALDAIRQVRPEFLRASMRTPASSYTVTEPVVYENGRYLGGIDRLAMIPVDALVEVERVEAIEARARLGVSCRCDGGVIFIRTR